MNQHARRVLLYGSLALASLLVATGCSACSALGFDQYDNGDVKMPAKQPPAETNKPAAADSSDSNAADPSAPEPDTEGDINVVWTAKSGSARQDPIGLLDGTPFSYENLGLFAAKSVNFTPTSPSKNKKGRYVYTLKLHPSDRKTNEYTGYMEIDWTMTIAYPTSRNEFHSVYKGDVTAMFDPSTRILTDGVAKGTAKTVDTFISGDTKVPRKTSGDFVWTFKTK